MSLTYGFYNSRNGDRVYDAVQMSSIFDGIIKDGVYSNFGDHLAVKANEGMTVSIGSGRAWFNHTWTYNDTDITREVTRTTNPLLNKWAAIVLEINSEVEARENTIKVIYGEELSEGAVKPEMIRSATVNQYALAYIYVKGEMTEIGQSDIENAIGTDETPLATGLFEVMSAEMFIKQWEAEYKKNISEDTEAFDQWFRERKIEYQAIFGADQAEFEEWFANLKVQLDENVAANLQRQIDDIIPITFAEIDSIL